MPFKGDMRLGGPHDNEASLNGTSDGPSVPSAGTVLQSGIQNPITASIQTASNDPTMIDVEVGTGTYNLVADGTGGTYLQLASASYLPTGTWVGPRWGDDEPNTSTYVDGFGNFYNYQNGIYSVSRHVSDGSGGVVFSQYAETYGNFYADGTPVSGAPEESIFYLTTTHPESSSEILNGRYTYDSLVWDGVGGISLTTGGFFTGGSYYPDGTLESDASDTYVEVPAGSNNYFFDGNDNRWEWDGNGNIVFRYSGLYSDGTYITTYGDYNYYWNGSGGFYESYNGGGGGGGYPSYGTPTGNTGTSGTYVDINGNQVQTGSYDWTEYYDGQGGTYQESSNTSYYSYGTYIYGESSYNYYSDGMGSYYSEWYDSTGGGGGGGCPSSGTPTGNTSSGTNYIDINGSQYENGTYSGTEYHDGNCSTYWENSYSYASYGTLFTQEDSYDEWGGWVGTTYYYSDGNGSYYTGS